MAKDKTTRDRARFMYEHDGKGYDEIAKELGISKGSITAWKDKSKQKNEPWIKSKNRGYIDEKVNIIIETKHLNEKLNEKLNKNEQDAKNIVNTDGSAALNAANKIAIDEANKRLLLEGTGMKIVDGINGLLERGKTVKQVIDKEGNLIDVEEELDMFQYKAAAEATDKVSLTTCVNKRHANTIITNNNSQQTNLGIINTLIARHEEKNRDK